MLAQTKQVANQTLVSTIASTQMSCIRQLGDMAIYSDTHARVFFLINGNSYLFFNDLDSAIKYVIKAHAEAIDQKNRQWI